jgi:hypothetical protein
MTAYSFLKNLQEPNKLYLSYYCWVQKDTSQSVSQLKYLGVMTWLELFFL